MINIITRWHFTCFQFYITSTTIIGIVHIVLFLLVYEVMDKNKQMSGWSPVSWSRTSPLFQLRDNKHKGHFYYFGEKLK